MKTYLIDTTIQYLAVDDGNILSDIERFSFSIESKSKRIALKKAQKLTLEGILIGSSCLKEFNIFIDSCEVV